MKLISILILAGLIFINPVLITVAPLLIWLAWRMKKRIDKFVKLVRYARRFEPIFVLPNDTGLDGTIGRLSDLCIFVAPKMIAKTVTEERAFLEMSGNQFAANGIPVIGIYKGHGPFVNETDQEYNERAKDLIRSVRAEWHTKLAEYPDWYERYHHLQKI